MSRKYVTLFCFITLVVLIMGCSKAVKDPFAGMEQAVDDQYGYTAENPVRIGYYKDFGDNIALCKYYLFCLRTIDGERLLVLDRVSVDDPKYDPSHGGFLGLHSRGEPAVGGILDEYTLVTESGKDSLQIYFDIYHNEPLAVPKGMTFAEPTDSASVTP